MKTNLVQNTFFDRKSQLLCKFLAVRKFLAPVYGPSDAVEFLRPLSCSVQLLVQLGGTQLKKYHLVSNFFGFLQCFGEEKLRAKLSFR